jgi:acyl-CoA synthetase (AMP-forming)/AMP-acid ligase II
MPLCFVQGPVHLRRVRRAVFCAGTATACRSSVPRPCQRAVLESKRRLRMGQSRHRLCREHREITTGIVCPRSLTRLQLDSLPVSWAVHNLSGISSPANAAYGVAELTPQVEQCKSQAIFTTVSLLNVALAAAKACGIPDQRLYLLGTPDDCDAAAHWCVYLNRFKSVGALIDEGSKLPALEPLKWKKGQGARQCAFLMFSSGTSGLPVNPTHRSRETELIICPCRKPLWCLTRT